MHQYRLRADITLTFDDLEAIQAIAHRATERIIADQAAAGSLLTPDGIARTPKEAANYAAQEPRSAVTMLIIAMLAEGGANVPGLQIKNVSVEYLDD